MEKYTVRDSKTGEIIKTDIVIWDEVEALLTENIDFEYATEEVK